MRADGTQVKDLTSIMKALPYIIPRRCDAQNWGSDMIDEDIVKTFIRRKRREGRRVPHMSVLVAAYCKAALEYPKVNYFIMNRKIYRRNHFCFSFVLLKKRADGTPDETTLKAFLKPEDTVFTISSRVQELSDRNGKAAHSSTDKFADLTFAVPCFICMGKPVRKPDACPGEKGSVMPLGVVVDERIASSIEYPRFFAAFSRNMRNMDTMETRLDGMAAASDIGIKEVAL